MAMALDEPKDNDEVYEVEGYKYLIDKDFLAKAQPVKVDFVNYGFKFDCAIEFGGGSCGSSCGSSDCG